MIINSKGLAKPAKKVAHLKNKRVFSKRLIPASDAPFLNIQKSLTAFIQKKDHPCLAAQSVFKNKAIRYGLYDQLGTKKAAVSLAKDLSLFLTTREAIKAPLVSFIAVFENPVFLEEAKFEQLLWQQLQELHHLDTEEWDNTVSENPDDPNFSFSFMGIGFYIIGLHPNSSRKARQFPQPALVFNLHAQFEALREKGHYEKMRDAIRERDKELQGSINPMVEDHGLSSEAKQYSGRQVDDNWKCPWHKKE